MCCSSVEYCENLIHVRDNPKHGFLRIKRKPGRNQKYFSRMIFVTNISRIDPEGDGVISEEEQKSMVERCTFHCGSNETF